MKKSNLHIAILFLMLILSCDENPIFIDCNDCTQDEPDHAKLVLKMEEKFSTWYYTAVVRIYEGNLEDNILLYLYYVNEKEWTVDVPLNKKYTITATYNDINGKDYIAVDTAYPRVKYEKSSCENPCYYVYDHIVNLRIKYTN